jgi:23S rRNA (cytosine1962-C5)-methyltransferase
LLISGPTTEIDLPTLLDRALEARSGLLEDAHTGALRLFNGFTEGCPQLVADLYARTLVLTSHASAAEHSRSLLGLAQARLHPRLPWLGCIIQKDRADVQAEARRGRLSLGAAPDTEISENGVRYAIDLLLNQDESFYLDTRSLRAWLKERSAGWNVLNLFAYTGSLGIAALAGGAGRVVQVDINRKFLELARKSASLNRLDWSKMELRTADFFSQVSQMKQAGELFDCVIADPPFFSTTAKGRVDLLSESARLVNKLRPLVKDGGFIVMVNNALFLSGADYLKSLETLTADGYVSIVQTLPVPAEVIGFGGAPVYPADPAPFNHPTKMVVLQVKRK